MGGGCTYCEYPGINTLRASCGKQRDSTRHTSLQLGIIVFTWEQWSAPESSVLFVFVLIVV